MKHHARKYGKKRRLSRAVSFFFYLKRNHLWLRRFAFLWLFLIAIELACPILECPNFEDFNSAATTATTNFYESNSAKSILQKNSDDEQLVTVKGNTAPEDCNDECLCHVTAIVGIVFEFPGDYPEYSFVKNIYTNEPTVTISPPSQPPKNA